MPFILQVAEDFCGPRKEFFRIAVKSVKERYFDNGLQEMFSEDYLIIGLFDYLVCKTLLI